MSTENTRKPELLSPERLAEIREIHRKHGTLRCVTDLLAHVDAQAAAFKPQFDRMAQAARDAKDERDAAIARAEQAEAERDLAREHVRDWQKRFDARTVDYNAIDGELREAREALTEMAEFIDRFPAGNPEAWEPEKKLRARLAALVGPGERGPGFVDPEAQVTHYEPVEPPVPVSEQESEGAEGAGFDLKYGRVTVERGGFKEGEPVFVLRGNDSTAVNTLDWYRHLCEINGAAIEHLNAVDRAKEAFETWRHEHGTKTPDVTPTPFPEV